MQLCTGTHRVCIQESVEDELLEGLRVIEVDSSVNLDAVGVLICCCALLQEVCKVGGAEFVDIFRLAPQDLPGKALEEPREVRGDGEVLLIPSGHADSYTVQIQSYGGDSSGLRTMETAR